jgi:hypothetical protein
MIADRRYGTVAGGAVVLARELERIGPDQVGDLVDRFAGRSS